MNKSKEEMEGVSLGIAAEMTDTDTAELIGENGKSGDAKVQVWIVRGVRVASTNGDPVWEEQDQAIFDDLLSSEGIKI